MDLPQPTWEPVDVESVSEIVERMRVYTDEKRAFVAYKFGTVVFSDSSSARSDVDYETTLMSVVHQPPDFKVMPMEDGNLLVRFAGPVSGLVLAKHYADRLDEIRSNVVSGGLLPGEQLVTPTEIKADKDHYFAGVYARAKLYRDTASRQIVERFVPTGEKGVRTH